MSLFDIMKNGKNAMRAYEYALKANTANMGNVETAGYKGLEYSFQTIFNQVLADGSRASSMQDQGGSNPMQLGSSVALSGVRVNFEQGDVTEGGSLSAAIIGNGLFMVSEDGGKSFLYTRAGDFALDSDGYLVDPKGRRVYGYKMGSAGKPITSKLVPIHVEGHTDVGWDYQAKSGTLVGNYSAYKAAYDAGQPLPEVPELYQLAMTTFKNRSGLLQYDGTTFKETEASGRPLDPKVSGQGYGDIYSQSLEKSNVFYIGETMDALAVQRAMSASLTAIKLASQQIQTIIQQLGS